LFIWLWKLSTPLRCARWTTGGQMFFQSRPVSACCAGLHAGPHLIDMRPAGSQPSVFHRAADVVGVVAADIDRQMLLIGLGKPTSRNLRAYRRSSRRAPNNGFSACSSSTMSPRSILPAACRIPRAGADADAELQPLREMVEGGDLAVTIRAHRHRMPVPT
jgi:hypothetical protein